MSIRKRLKNGDTFCVLPWISEYKTVGGTAHFCCHSNIPIVSTSDPSTDELRLKIWNNEKIVNCNKCYELEHNNIISPRQRESINLLKFNNIRNHFEAAEGPWQFKKYFADIRVNNKCNLSCITCGPGNSSLWEKELGIIPITTSSQHNYTKDEIKELTRIYIGGGEPLINDHAKLIIKMCADYNPQIELVINTNLTYLDKSLIKQFKAITNTTIVVSIDAYGAVNEYHRYPLKWSKFIRNLKWLKNENINILFNTVASAVSVFGFKNLKRLEVYPSGWNLTLIHPRTNLELRNIPDSLKSTAIDNVVNLKKSKFYKTDLKFKTQVDGIINNISQPVDNVLGLKKYIQELDLRRNLKHQNYLGVNLIEAA